MPGPYATSGILAVPRIQSISNVHSFDNLSDRNELFFVVSWAIVSKIDEQLSRPSVWDGESVGHRAADIRFDSGIVGYGLCPPLVRDLRIAIDTELSPTAGDDSKEPIAVIVAAPDQLDRKSVV